ncbi:MAG: endonuclease, partial [Streptomyces sp.]|nr:endonuclease [Streptomyces sp.]
MPNHRRVTRRLSLKATLAAAVTVPLAGAAISASSAPSPSTQARRAPRLEVMTFNLRFASTKEPNSWSDRRPVMGELLRRAHPHVIGT